MAQRKVSASTANAAKGSFIWELAAIVNQIAGALTGDGVLSAATFGENSGTPEDFDIGPFRYRIGGVEYFKEASSGLSFSAAHVVTAEKFGAILVQVDESGTISTLVGETTQTTAMAYDTADEAVAALPEPSQDNVAVGYLVIEADNGNWTANTDDLSTDLADVTWVPAAPDYSAAIDTITTRELGAPR